MRSLGLWSLVLVLVGGLTWIGCSTNSTGSGNDNANDNIADTSNENESGAGSVNSNSNGDADEDVDDANPFSDGEFLDRNWTSVKAFDNTPGAAAESDAYRMESGGSPDAYRHVHHYWRGPNGNVVMAHLRNGAVYDPGEQGPVVSIDASFDARFSPVVNPFAVGYAPLLMQDGYYYHLSSLEWVSSVTREEWARFEFAQVVPEDFALIGGGAGPDHPDFSENGSRIQFGYSTSNGTATEDWLTTDSGIDNWSVTVTPGTPDDDTEPAFDYIPFEDGEGGRFYFDTVQVIGDGLGHAARFPVYASEAHIYSTMDGGATWSLINEVETGDTSISAFWWMYFHPDLMAISTSASGFGVSGSLSVSQDSAANWKHYEEGARQACDIESSEGIGAFVVFNDSWWTIVGENGDHLAAREGPASLPGGAWSCTELPVYNAILASADDGGAGNRSLFMWANESGSSFDWNIYLWDWHDGGWFPLREHLPADFWLSAWATAKREGTITLIDAEGVQTESYSALTIDPGHANGELPLITTFFSHGPDGDEEGYFLKRAIQVGDESYVSLEKDPYSYYSDAKIKKFNGAAEHWQTIVHEENSSGYYYYFQTDYAGGTYAIRWSSYATGLYDLSGSGDESF